MKHIILTEKGQRHVVPLDSIKRLSEGQGKERGLTLVFCDLEGMDFVAEESLDEIIEMMMECDVELLEKAND